MAFTSRVMGGGEGEGTYFLVHVSSLFLPFRVHVAPFFFQGFFLSVRVSIFEYVIVFRPVVFRKRISFYGKMATSFVRFLFPEKMSLGMISAIGAPLPPSPFEARLAKTRKTYVLRRFSSKNVKFSGFKKYNFKRKGWDITDFEGVCDQISVLSSQFLSPGEKNRDHSQTTRVTHLLIFTQSCTHFYAFSLSRTSNVPSFFFSEISLCRL